VHGQGVRVSEVTESYCETIYNMMMEGEQVIGARLAEKFRVSAPTVTENLKRLVRDGYVEMDSRRAISLTSQGITMAEAVLRRHRLTERFLVDMLGMPWHQVHDEAGRLEHYISGAVESRVIATLGHPTTCPHGNPIPGEVPNARTYLTDRGAFRLPQARLGEPVTLLCVSEVVEDEEALIRYLHEREITPGTRLSLDGEVPERPDDTVTLRANGRPVVISAHAAHALWVVRASRN
jgi:DtxR family transcriptional regulator, Mn-dependent transcriptional regulator